MGGEPGHARTAGARPGARPHPGRRLPAALPGARLQARLLGAAGREAVRAPATGTLEDLGLRPHALMVTFRRDGTPVATPVWVAPGGDRLYVRSERRAGKVKRLSANPRALLAPSTARGRRRGAPLAVLGRVLESHEEPAAERALARRHGRVRALFEGMMDLIRVDMCFLELTPESDARGRTPPPAR